MNKPSAERWWGIGSLVSALILLAAILAVAGCSGPRAINTDSANFAAINYGKYTGANGDTWELAGGKDGTGVALRIVKNADGSTMVEWTAENYDATTVLAKMNERLAAERDAALKAAGLLVGVPAP